MAIKLLKRHLYMLTALCAPYATLLMVREPNNYKYGILQVKGRDTIERKILSYDRLMDWVDRGFLVRMVAPRECYEITPLGRDVVAAQEEPEAPAPRWKWLEYGKQAQRAMGK